MTFKELIGTPLGEIDWTTMLKNILLFSGTIKNKIVQFLINNKVPMDETQVQIVLILVNLVLIYIVFKFASGLKKPLKIAIIALLVWFFIGFWT